MAEVSVLELMDRYGALGPDFLTWLCVRSNRDDLPAPPSEPGLQVTLHGPMVLTSEMGEATKITLAGDEAAAAPELVSALANGKRLIRSKVDFTAQDSTWVFTLDAETFDLKSIKLPVPKVPDLDEFMSMRVQATQLLSNMIHELFELFLPVRLDPTLWKAEVESWSAGS